MALQIHLPLNPIDSVNRPPLKFLQVQDGLVVLTGGLWTAAYILYILQARKDHSYGMPVIALYDSVHPTSLLRHLIIFRRCANIAWEAIYAVFYPLSASETFTFVFWLAIDLGIVHSTITNAPREWKQAPLIANHMGLIIAFGSTLFLLLHWALITTIGSPDDAGLWSGFATQVLLGFGSVVHLLSRNSTRGHSLTIW